MNKIRTNYVSLKKSNKINSTPLGTVKRKPVSQSLPQYIPYIPIKSAEPLTIYIDFMHYMFPDYPVKKKKNPLKEIQIRNISLIENEVCNAVNKGS